MKICILCEDSKVETVRKTAEPIMGKNTLKIRTSSTGVEPATHWFCFLTVTQVGYDKLLSIKEHSIMEESSPKEFLEKWELRIIK